MKPMLPHTQISMAAPTQPITIPNVCPDGKNEFEVVLEPPVTILRSLCDGVGDQVKVEPGYTSAAADSDIEGVCVGVSDTVGVGESLAPKLLLHVADSVMDGVTDGDSDSDGVALCVAEMDTVAVLVCVLDALAPELRLDVGVAVFVSD